MSMNTPSRRVSEPHHHQQPRYPDPDVRSRRHTEAGALQRVHSRPEDYKNKPRPSNLVEYICFDQDNQQVNRDQRQAKYASNRRHRNSSEESGRGSGSDSGYDDDEEDDSEEELTLPSNYRSRSSRRTNKPEFTRPEYDRPRRDRREEYDRVGRHSSARPQSHSSRRSSPNDADYYLAHPPQSHRNQYLCPPVEPHSSGYHDTRRNSWHGPDVDPDDRFAVHPVTRHNTHSNVGNEYDSRSHNQSRRRSHDNGSASSEVGAKIISEIAHHLQSNKDSYSSKHGKGPELVNQLVGQVMRKVADGSLNGDMVKDVLREVQHIL